MRYTDQAENKDHLIDVHTQVRSIRTIEFEEGEIMDTDASAIDVLDLNTRESWDDYRILAVGKSRIRHRSTIGKDFKKPILNFMIVNGSRSHLSTIKRPTS